MEAVRNYIEKEIEIPLLNVKLQGNLVIPGNAGAIVVFAHGSGSSRYSPRNQFVARVLHEAGFATLLIDLLTAREEEEDRRTGHLRFDITLLSTRVKGVTKVAVKCLAVTEGARARLETSGPWSSSHFGPDDAPSEGALVPMRRPEVGDVLACRYPGGGVDPSGGRGGTGR